MKKTSLAALFIAAAVFASCSKEDDKSPEIIIEKDNATLVYGGEFQIKATSDYDLTYESEDENHATVDEKGLVKATFVGETNIVVSNTEKSKKVKITVRPEYTLYDEPILFLGMTKSQVISKLGEPVADKDGIISYLNYSSYAPILMFKIDNDKVTSISVMLETTYTTKLAKYLGERYYYLGQQNDIHAFVNNVDFSKATASIAMSVYSASYLMVLYMEYTDK